MNSHKVHFHGSLISLVEDFGCSGNEGEIEADLEMSFFALFSSSFSLAPGSISSTTVAPHENNSLDTFGEKIGDGRLTIGGGEHVEDKLEGTIVETKVSFSVVFLAHPSLLHSGFLVPPPSRSIPRSRIGGEEIEDGLERGV